MSRPVDDVFLRWRTVVTVVGLHAGSWIAAGAALQLILHAIGSDASWALLLAATSLSWAAGLLAVPVPAGLGIRETALVAMLASEVSTGTAVAVALASRVLFVGLDVLCLVVSFPAGAVLTKPSATTSTARHSAPG